MTGGDQPMRFIMIFTWITTFCYVGRTYCMDAMADTQGKFSFAIFKPQEHEQILTKVNHKGTTNKMLFIGLDTTTVKELKQHAAMKACCCSHEGIYINYSKWSAATETDDRLTSELSNVLGSLHKDHGNFTSKDLARLLTIQHSTISYVVLAERKK